MDETSVNLSLPDVAAGVAHAMNNLLAMLYGAASHLEDAAQSPCIARANSAIGSACATGKALSAALYLLSLPEADASTFAPGTSAAHLLDAVAQARIFEALREVAAVGCTEPITAKSLKVQLDPDTLTALLICAAFSLRREAGPREVIQYAMRIEHGAEGDHAALVFQLDSPHMAARAVATSTPVREAHPCAIALAHFSTIIPVERAALHQDRAGAIQLRLPLVP
jgi:hypothetical protein